VLIGGETRLVGLLRHPLRDSLSPPMQNAAFQAAGLNWASGGAAQAVATALVDAGCASLRVAARSAEKAHALAARLRGLAAERAVDAADEWPPPAGDADLVLNATPVRDEPLVDLGAVRQVVDLAYNPDGSETALVAAARAAGCERVVDGLDVLVAQGAASFERWTGVEAPVQVMQAAVRSLSP
jgi:shikimate dehydrogenase